MKDEIREDLLKRVYKFNNDTWVDDIEIMNQILYSDNIFNCEHEYALRSINPWNDKVKVLCLDCGRSINEDECQNIINISKKNFHYLDSIRLRYLELLYFYNTKDSIKRLSEKCGMKLTLVKNK